MAKRLNTTREELIAALRSRAILRTERAGIIIGYCCDYCGKRWRGRKEKHQPYCILAGTETRK